VLRQAQISSLFNTTLKNSILKTVEPLQDVAMYKSVHPTAASSASCAGVWRVRGARSSAGCYRLNLPLPSASEVYPTTWSICGQAQQKHWPLQRHAERHLGITVPNLDLRESSGMHRKAFRHNGINLPDGTERHFEIVKKTPTSPGQALGWKAFGDNQVNHWLLQDETERRFVLTILITDLCRKVEPQTRILKPWATNLKL